MSYRGLNLSILKQKYQPEDEPVAQMASYRSLSRKSSPHDGNTSTDLPCGRLSSRVKMRTMCSSSFALRHRSKLFLSRIFRFCYCYLYPTYVNGDRLQYYVFCSFTASLPSLVLELHRLAGYPVYNNGTWSKNKNKTDNKNSAAAATLLFAPMVI